MVAIHGRMLRDERRNAEQRFGRIHRIGQTEVCHLWNLVAFETREGFVSQCLFQKLEEERQALGGKVFDILGKMTFDNRSLRELLIEAVRYGNDPKVKARLNEVVDNTINPHFIEAFFVEAFQSVGGKIRRREKGRYEIASVPYAVRNRDTQIGYGEPVLNRYERVCFDKEFCNIQGFAPAALICPGHPLLDATLDLVRERSADVMKRGAVFIDENDFGTSARLLFYIEDSVQDGIILKDGSRRTISKHIHFVEVDGAKTHTVYLKEPFNGIDKPGFLEVSRNFSIVKLVQNAKIVYQE